MTAAEHSEWRRGAAAARQGQPAPATASAAWLSGYRFQAKLNAERGA